MQPFRTYGNRVTRGTYDYQDEDDFGDVIVLDSTTSPILDFFYRKIEFPQEDAERKASLLLEQAKIKEKAEKKRLKKQKQKERKRQEKMEKEKEQTATASGNLEVGDKLRDSTEATTDTQVGVEVREEGGAEAGAVAGSSGKSNSSNVSDTESYDVETLDFTSCFVSQATQKVRHMLEAKPKLEKEKNKSHSKEQLPKKSHDDVRKKASAGSVVPSNNVEISNDLATRGNKWARDGRYDLAVDCFTQAIQYNPTEFKLFGNRAFCLEKMQEYEKALADAELSLNMSPGWIKGLFRKGRALAGLKRYEEAVQALREVLKLDSSCREAAQELMRTQILQLMSYGFTQEQSSNALIIHGTVPKAHEVLSKLNPQIASQVPAAPESLVKSQPLGKVHSASNVQRQEDRHLELFPVWVGNLTLAVTEQLLFNMFSKAGSLHSVKLLVDRRCAFVNFTRQEYCDEAIRLFHNFELMGSWIAVRYPDKIPARGVFSKAALKAQDLRSDNSQRNSNASNDMRPSKQ
ncbi:uncharacterized protein LOC144035487 isoform X2 [Vanacampus margaritifer]